MSKNSPRSDTAEILDEVRTTNAETPLVLPDPLPDGTNPFLVIQWCLFTAFVAARHLTDERQKRVEQLGRKMRTEEYRGVLHLHREDDVDRQTVERTLTPRLWVWHKAHAEARNLCATLAIPFAVYDPVLKAAQKQMQDSWEIIWGVASDKEVHVRNDITKRLYELAESTTQAVIVPVAPPELGSNGTKQSEGGTPAAPFVPLTSWNDIFGALNEPHGYAHWKNDAPTRDKIRKLNTEHNGPIVFPKGKGKQPSVDKGALLTWWKSLSEHYDARTEREKAEAESARLTVADSHNYGASGQVVPGIGGSVKRTRAKTTEKGKEKKR